MRTFQPNAWIVGGSYGIRRYALYQRVAKLVEAQMLADGYNIHVRAGRKATVKHLPESALDFVRYWPSKYQPPKTSTGNPLMIDHQRGVIWFGVERAEGEWDRAGARERMRIASELFVTKLREHRAQFRREVLDRAKSDVDSLISKIRGTFK